MSVATVWATRVEWLEWARILCSSVVEWTELIDIVERTNLIEGRLMNVTVKIGSPSSAVLVGCGVQQSAQSCCFVLNMYEIRGSS